MLSRLLLWSLLILAAIALPIYAVGYEWRQTHNCVPDLPDAAFAETRKIALMTWFVTLVCLGGWTWLTLNLLGKSGRIIWWAFGAWKALSLGLALVTTPGCFESYSYLAERGHPLETLLGSLTVLSWLALIGTIVFRAGLSSRTSTPSN